jgi:hypothetical protein
METLAREQRNFTQARALRCWRTLHTPDVESRDSQVAHEDELLAALLRGSPEQVWRRARGLAVRPYVDLAKEIQARPTLTGLELANEWLADARVPQRLKPSLMWIRDALAQRTPPPGSPREWAEALITAGEALLTPPLSREIDQAALRHDREEREARQLPTKQQFARMLEIADQEPALQKQLGAFLRKLIERSPFSEVETRGWLSTVHVRREVDLRVSARALRDAMVRMARMTEGRSLVPIFEVDIVPDFGAPASLGAAVFHLPGRFVEGTELEETVHHE